MADGAGTGAGSGGVFAAFAGCVLGDLMYVLQDSLDRLAGPKALKP